jgi:hypothetical protein
MTMPLLFASSFAAFELPIAEVLTTWAPIAVAVLAAVGVVGVCVFAVLVAVLASSRRAAA